MNELERANLEYIYSKEWFYYSNPEETIFCVKSNNLTDEQLAFEGLIRTSREKYEAFDEQHKANLYKEQLAKVDAMIESGLTVEQIKLLRPDLKEYL